MFKVERFDASAVLADANFDVLPFQSWTVSSLSALPAANAGTATRVTTSFDLTAAGSYTFEALYSADIDVLIDGVPVGTAPIALQAGEHRLELRYLAAVDAVPALFWTGPETGGARLVFAPTPDAGQGLTATFYDTGLLNSVDAIDFEAAPIHVTSVGQIAHENIKNAAFYDGGPTDTFAVRYTGQISAPQTGNYTFYLASDDSAALYIDGAPVIVDNGFFPLRENAITLRLDAGDHDIEVRHASGLIHTALKLTWDGPSTNGPETIQFGPTPQTGLTAEYFVVSNPSKLADIDFAATPDATEIVDDIQANVGGGALWTGGPQNNFAARYSGAFDVLNGGTYTFYLTSDDGSALYIDGQRVITNDGLHGARLITADVDLSAGAHTIELRYFERGGLSVVDLDWSGDDTAGQREAMTFGRTDGIAVQYFNLPNGLGSLSAVDFDATPDAVDVVSTIRQDAGLGAFWDGGQTDKFAARYQGQFEAAEPGLYTFYLGSDDGSQLFIDGQLIINNDGNKPVTELSASVQLSRGTHDIDVRYYENGGLAEVFLDWNGPGIDGRTPMRFDTRMDAGLKAEYFAVPLATSLNDIDFTVAPATVDRAEHIDFNAGGGAAWAGGPTNGFAIKYTGSFDVQTGSTYTFYLTGDDGAALYIDGALVIDNDGLHAAKTLTGSVQVQAGVHDIEVRYFERGGQSSLKLEWDGAGTNGREVMYFGPQEIDEGLRVEYWEIAPGATSLDDITFDGKPDQVGKVDTIQYSGNGQFYDNGPSDWIAARYSGDFTVETAGTYTFYLTSDDGSVLYVNGEELILNDGIHAAVEKTATVTLGAGTHDIEVRYFEAAGGAVIDLDWSGPDTGDVRAPVWFGADDDRPAVAQEGDVVSSFSLIEDAVDVALAIPQTDADGDALTITSVFAASDGTVRLAENGVLLYTPNPEFNGNDQFRYEAADASGQVTTGFVQLDVNDGHGQPFQTVDPRISPEIGPSGDALIFRRLAELPDDGTAGGIPRPNGAITHNGEIYTWTEGKAAGEGRIYKVGADGSVDEWFDLGTAVLANTGRDLNNANVVHGGLRSIDFHPDFDTNGKFYTSIMEDRPADPGAHNYLSDATNPIGADSVLVEWTVNLTTGEVDADSYREVFRIGMPVFDHTIRAITFNQFAAPGDEDYGLLYIAHGDGSVQSATAGGGQNNDGLGKIIRIDPLQDGENPYAVPDSNPFVGDSSMLDEVYALGFRNPHTMSFNQAEDGNVYLINSGVGRDNFDEINIVEKGGNYGWSEREGPLVHNVSGGLVNGVSALPADEAEFAFIYPASFYGHDGAIGNGFGGQAWNGGHVIDNGSELDGKYIAGDFGSSGRIFTVAFDDLLAADTKVTEGEDPATALTWAELGEVQLYFDHDDDAATLPVAYDTFTSMIESFRSDFRFGEGPDGELIVTSKRTGDVYVAVNTLPSDHPDFQSSSFDDPFLLA